MNGSTPGPDPVDDFFAAERAAVPSVDGGQQRWLQIMSEAGRRGLRPWARHAAAAAAAAVLVGAGVWALLGRAGPSPSVPAGTESSSSPAPTVSTQGPTSSSSGPSSPTSQSAAAPTAAGPVPTSFQVRSVSTADNSHLFALGAVACPGAPCAAVAASDDNGATWRQVHVFTGLGVAGGVGSGPGDSGVVGEVRFASPQVGWVFGGAVRQTLDGGVTWHDYPHPGGPVLDLSTDGSDVVLTTADRCASGSCSGAISVVRAPVGARSATDVVGTLSGGGGIDGARITWSRGNAYVSPQVRSEPGSPPGPVEVLAHGLHPAGPASCGLGFGGIELVGSASGGRLFALCPSGSAAGHIGYAVQSSGDGGATWQPVSTQALFLVNAGQVSFAAADARTLLAVSGGTPDLHGSMLLSADGGVTWADPLRPPKLPDRGWAWVGAPGGRVFYAISGDLSGSYWKSRDAGRTWQPVHVAGG